jgi:hypothetical protein
VEPSGPGAGIAPDHDRRTALVVVLLVLWTLVAVLAAPGIRRRPLPAEAGVP